MTLPGRTSLILGDRARGAAPMMDRAPRALPLETGGEPPGTGRSARDDGSAIAGILGDSKAGGRGAAVAWQWRHEYPSRTHGVDRRHDHLGSVVTRLRRAGGCQF